MKPRLTQKALSGLGALAGLVDAGGPAEITGYDYEQMCQFAKKGSPAALRSWEEIGAACEWIRRMQRHVGGPENVAE